MVLRLGLYLAVRVQSSQRERARLLACMPVSVTSGVVGFELASGNGKELAVRQCVSCGWRQQGEERGTSEMATVADRKRARESSARASGPVGATMNGGGRSAANEDDLERFIPPTVKSERNEKLAVSVLV